MSVDTEMFSIQVHFVPFLQDVHDASNTTNSVVGPIARHLPGSIGLRIENNPIAWIPESPAM
jgi:hypothetical protein